ncbi:hypothetical protein PO909_032777 [Leuciscus waleckii]
MCLLFSCTSSSTRKLRETVNLATAKHLDLREQLKIPYVTGLTRSQNQSGCRSDLKTRPNATLCVSPLYSVDICKTATSKKQEWHGKTGTGPAGLLTSRASHHPGGGLEPTKERQRDWEGLMSNGRRVQRSRARDNCWEDFKLKHSEVGEDGFRKYATAKTALTYRSVILTHVTIRKEFVCAVTLCQ